MSPLKKTSQLLSHINRNAALDGARQRLQSNLKQMVKSGRAEMMKRAPLCNSAFGEEWAKRMLTRMKAGDFLNVVTTTFERHLDDSEIKQLIAFRKSRDMPEARPVSPELKKKLDAVMPSIQSEIMGGSVQVGSRLGAEIG